MLARIISGSFRLLAIAVRFVCINRVSFEQRDGREFVRKRRNWLAWLLIFPGNLVFRFRRPVVRVLHYREWLAWERLVNESLGRETIESNADLVTEKVAGMPLSDVLDGCSDFSQRVVMFTAAASSLRTLHSTSVHVPQIGDSLLSHGDASVQNVLYDAVTGFAQWIDFDLRHKLHQPAGDRQADDLRALLFTAAPFFSIDELPHAVAAAREGYGDLPVWKTLRERLCGSRNRLAFDVFHLTQLRRGRSRKTSGLKRAELDARLIATIAETDS